MIDLSLEQTRRVAAPTPARVLDPSADPTPEPTTDSLAHLTAYPI